MEKTAPKLNDDEKAFLEYVQNMRPSLGQRFLVSLLQDSGYDAYEKFWKKLRDARYGDASQLHLNMAEATALAKAMDLHDRRSFLRLGAGSGMFVLGVLLGGSSMKKASERMERQAPMAPGEKTDFVIRFGAAAALLLGGVKLLDEMPEPSQNQVEHVAYGLERKKNMLQLVEALDALFKPVEVSMTETGVRRRL